VYDLNVNAATDTTLTLFLGGGKVGDYNLVVKKQNFGTATVSDNTIDDFSY